MSGRHLVVGQFAAVVVALLALTAARMFLGGATGFLLLAIGLPTLALSALVVLGYALWRPSWRKAAVCLGALAAGALALLATPAVSRAGTHLFFRSRQAGLDAFVGDILAYGRIHRMSDGQRHFKELNGELVAYEPARVDTAVVAGLRPTLPVERVLARDAIDPARYEEFRRRLAALKLIEFEVAPGYVAFLYDGMLDNLEGFLYVREGAAPPSLRSELFAAELIALRPMRGRWYWFATT